MRVRRVLIVASAFVLGLAEAVLGQNPQAPMAPGPKVTTPSGKMPQDCPPAVDEQKAPSLGGDTIGSGKRLSRQLSESDGVVYPPAGIDPGIVERPPSGGALKIIPPPGSVGGDRSIIPK
jgi:hypothetical protein